MNLINWLYDPTPITPEWLVECGGIQVAWPSTSLLGAFDFSGRGIINIGRMQWELGGLKNYIATRGEFRRACELLGIVTAEVRPEDERPKLLERVAKLEAAIIDHTMSRRSKCENDEGLIEVLDAKNEQTKGGA